MKRILNILILLFSINILVANDGIVFTGTSYESVVSEAKSQGKLVFLDFTASWCIPCKQMERETFSDPDVGSFVNSNFIPFKVDGDFFWGMDIAEKYNVKVYPTLMVIDGNGKVIKRITGFQTAQGLLNELKAFSN